jgi:hypothetical protein
MAAVSPASPPAPKVSATLTTRTTAMAATTERRHRDDRAVHRPGRGYRGPRPRSGLGSVAVHRHEAGGLRRGCAAVRAFGRRRRQLERRGRRKADPSRALLGRNAPERDEGAPAFRRALAVTRPQGPSTVERHPSVTFASPDVIVATDFTRPASVSTTPAASVIGSVGIGRRAAGLAPTR